MAKAKKKMPVTPVPPKPKKKQVEVEKNVSWGCPKCGSTVVSATLELRCTITAVVDDFDSTGKKPRLYVDECYPQYNHDEELVKKIKQWHCEDCGHRFKDFKKTVEKIIHYETECPSCGRKEYDTEEVNA